MHVRGLRFFVNRRPLSSLRRTADIVFPRKRVAVFLDGCFWHGCPLHHTVAKTNGAFWAKKVEETRRRDEDTNRQLREAGWVVLRVWEHEDLGEVAARIDNIVRPTSGGSKASLPSPGFAGEAPSCLSAPAADPLVPPSQSGPEG